jgi:hypothetical protein
MIIGPEPIIRIDLRLGFFGIFYLKVSILSQKQL